MNERLFRHPIRQVAYFVEDAIAAARRHAASFGSGPFYVAEHIPLTLCEHRGRSAELDHTSAYGQWGEVMIEFVQQNNEGASVFRDLYPGPGGGFHHIALIVDDLQSSMRDFLGAGFTTALYAEVGPGVGFAMMDCVREYGHFVELYEPTPVLLGVYELVRSSAQGFDGVDLIRSFKLV
jgi:Glyoxalase/Bleomycin resistance protein/Dioxygenase superfamily